MNQPWPWGITLRLRAPQGEFQLLLSADPELPAFHVTPMRFDNPLQAPLFSMVLRKHLEPARLLRIEQQGFDRVIQLVFEVYEEGGGRGERVLIVELIGRQGNLILVDGGSGRILDALKRREGDRGRDLLPGHPYTPPAPPSLSDDAPRIHPFRDDPDELMRALRLAAPTLRLRDLLIRRYMGLGALTVHELLARAGLSPHVQRGDIELEQLERLAHTVVHGLSKIAQGDIEPTLFFTPQGPDFWLYKPISVGEAERPPQTYSRLYEAASAAFEIAYQERRRERLRATLHRSLRRLHERATKKLHVRREELARAEQAEYWRHRGDLLTAYMHAVPAGATEVELPDYLNDGEPLRITLDAQRTPSENAQAYYEKYQKAKRAAQELERHVREAEVESTYLAQTLNAIELADELDDLEEIRDECIRQGLLPAIERKGAPRRRTQAVRQGPTRLLTAGGATVWVGRNNRQNDELTLRIALPDDIWLHTREIAGSHVILRPAAGSAEPTESDLFEAAEVAAYYSQARESSNVPVDYTRRKYVRKPAGAPPGYVLYERHRTLYVTPRSESIERMRARVAEEAQATASEGGLD